MVNKKVFFMFAVGIFVLVSLNFVSAGYCYQESANTTNQTGIDGGCSLNYSGSYKTDGFPQPPSGYPDNTYDGDYGTWWAPDYDMGNLYVNYTKPFGALNSSLWRVKAGNDAPVDRNISIDSCWDYYSNKLSLRIEGAGDSVLAFCYDGSWNLLDSFSGSTNSYVYEEAMWWGIDTTAPTITINSPLTTQTTSTTLFNITSTDVTTSVDTCQYSLDGNANITLSQNGDYWTDTNASMLDGSHTVNFYCNYTLGNLNTDSTTFFSDLNTITVCRDLNRSITYTLQNNITTDGDCFSTGTNNIILDMNNKNITGDGTSGDYGIDTSGDTNITIKDGFIYNFDIGIFSNSGQNNLDNMKITTSTSYGFYGENSDSNIINNSNLSGNSGSYDLYIVTSSQFNQIINTTYPESREFVGGTSNLTRKWYYQTYVNDTLGNNVIANLYMNDSFGNDVFSDTSDATGFSDVHLISVYDNLAGTKTDYRNHTVYAWNTSSEYVQINATSEINLTSNILNDFLTLTYDITPPLVDFATGTEANNTNFTRTYIFANVSYTEPNPQSVTFTLSNLTGIVNQTTKLSPNNATNTTINWTNLNDGLYFYNITVTDSGINSNTTETRWQRLDNTPPNIAIQKPTGNYANNNSIPLNYTVSDSLVGVSSCLYNVVNESGSLIISNTTLSNCQNSTFALPGGDVDYNVTVFVNDTLGNINSLIAQFGIRTNSPAITLDYPTSNLFFNTTKNINFNFTAIDSDGIDVCELYGDWTGNWTLNETFTSVTSGVQVNTQKNISDGTYLFNAKCNDTFGNFDFAASNTTFTIDTIKPLTIITTANETSVTGQSITIDYNITELNKQSCSFTLRNSTGSVHNYAANTTLDCDANSRTISVLSYGTYTFRIWGTDKAGNTNSSIITFTGVEPTSPPSGGGGGGTTQLEPAEDFSLRTINNQPILDISLPRKSARPRETEFLIINTGIVPIEIDLSCQDSLDDASLNKSTRGIRICNYVNFSNQSIEVIPNENQPQTVSVIVTSPEDAQLGDNYYFNIIGESQNDEFDDLSVKAIVSFAGEFYKYGNIPGVNITYPLSLLVFIASSLLLILTAAIFAFFKKPLLGLGIGVLVFGASLVLGILFFPLFIP